jgi:hypothetical protein
MPEQSLGEIACWGLILGTFAFAAARRFGEGAAIVAAFIAALGAKAALLNLN